MCLGDSDDDGDDQTFTWHFCALCKRWQGHSTDMHEDNYGKKSSKEVDKGLEDDDVLDDDDDAEHIDEECEEMGNIIDAASAEEDD
jgi:hypothetical protein